MMGRIPRPDLKKRFLCTICEAGTCELIVENYDKAPTFCPFDKEFGEYKWEEIPEGAENTEQANQPDSQYDLGGLILPGSMWAEP
jgi:hypothetical protein